MSRAEVMVKGRKLPGYFQNQRLSDVMCMSLRLISRAFSLTWNSLL